jgi:hypothetical protein
MSTAVPKRKQTRILVVGLISIVGLFCLASPFLHFPINWTKRFVSGQHPFGGSPIHATSHENLPSVAVESGRTICCRMELCDFRFPLPHGVRVAQTDSVSGGADTIKGAIYVTNADGGAVDLQAYARLVHKAGFHVSNTSEQGFFTASSPDGGALQVDGGQPTKIVFSFFGDY